MARYLSGPTLPYGKWNGIPIYLTTILTAVFILVLIVTAIAGSLDSPLVEVLNFTMPLRPAWSLWRLFTYVFLGQISFFTPFAVFCFYWFAVGIETHLGRGVLTRLLILLALTVPAIAAIFWWAFHEPSNALLSGTNSYMMASGLLVAFATLYPQTEAWGWIPFKWMAFACIFCGSLMLLRDHAFIGWQPLIELWVSCLVAFLYVRYAKDLEYDDYVSPVAQVKNLFRRKPKFRVVPAPSNAAYRAVINEPESELDALLDKIAKSGMDSLTPKEKASLQKAREALLRKDQR